MASTGLNTPFNVNDAPRKRRRLISKPARLHELRVANADFRGPAGRNHVSLVEHAPVVYRRARNTGCLFRAQKANKRFAAQEMEMARRAICRCGHRCTLKPVLKNVEHPPISKTYLCTAKTTVLQPLRP
jgi:hypothetical protein